MQINMQLEDDLKNQFESICNNVGLNTEMAITIFVNTMLQENKMPFDLVLKTGYTERRKKLELRQLKLEKAKRFERQINIALSNYSKSEHDKMKQKIIDDIYDIEDTTNFIPFEYFRMRLYRMDKSEWLNNYLADSDTFVLTERLNTCETNFDVSNKYEIYKRFKKYYKRDVMCATSKSDALEFSDFVKKHGKVLLKPLRGSLGQNIRVISLQDIEADLNYIDILLKDYPKGVLVEELIDQNDVMKSLNPASTNTLRIMTLRLDDEIRTYVALRIGTKNFITDALSNGGLTGRIDLETGEILDVRSSSGERFEKNPGCGAQLIGVKIPDIQGAINLAKELANKMPNYRYVGWDLALSKNGWVMIEFNGKSGVAVLQTALDRGLKKEFVEIFKKLNKPIDFPLKNKE